MTGPAESTSRRPFAPDWLIERIEQFAPSHSKKDRAGLYRALHRFAGKTFVGSDGFTFVLHTIVQAHALFVSPEAVALENERQKRLAAYWSERRRVEGQLGELQRHPLVRSLQWDLYAFDETCPHGVLRRECEERYEMRERLHLLQDPPLSQYVAKHLSALLKEHGHLIEQAASAFCRPRILPLNPNPLIRRGRRSDELARFLVQTIIGELVRAGGTVSQSSELLSRILLLCFGQAVEAGSIAKRWNRAGDTTSKRRADRK